MCHLVDVPGGSGETWLMCQVAECATWLMCQVAECATWLMYPECATWLMCQVVVTNTHLFYHPNAVHIRILQVSLFNIMLY
jgi:hypothetical protein